MAEDRDPMELVAARCVSFRELARSTAGLMNEIEKDGKIFAVSRYGRIVALLVPLPERLIIEFEGAASEIVNRTRPRAGEIDVDALELSDLACEFLIDAASTPTGYWNVPDSAFVADRRRCLRTLTELDLKGMMDFASAGCRRIRKEGRAVARTLRSQGRKGYEEMRMQGYHPPEAQPREGS